LASIAFTLAAVLIIGNWLTLDEAGKGPVEILDE
jgi:hypothetical protein